MAFEKEEEYDYGELEQDVFEHKRKRLATHALADQETSKASTNRHDVQIIAWQFTGTIGILLILGSVLVTLTGHASATVLVVPLIYMIAVILLMYGRE